MTWFRSSKIKIDMNNYPQVEDVIGIGRPDIMAMKESARKKLIGEKIGLGEGQVVWIFDGIQKQFKARVMEGEDTAQYSRIVGGNETTSYVFPDGTSSLIKENDLIIGGPANSATIL